MMSAVRLKLDWRYERLLNRFYEPLILLLALGKIRGEHVPGPVDDRSQQSIRRHFFDNLAYLGDHIKGGESTCAICPEERGDCYIVWIAANQTTPEIVSFIEEILEDVQAFLALEPNSRPEAERSFIFKCIDFGSLRITKEAQILFNSLEQCTKYLQEQSLADDIRLMRWMETLQVQDKIVLCLTAYGLRHTPERRILDARCEMQEGESENSPRLLAFKTARHLIGRLAHHVRAPMHILRDARHMDRLFERYSVRRVPFMESVPTPKKSEGATLESMLRRMFLLDDPDLPEYTDKLTALDLKLGVQKKVINLYKSPNFKPIVHAEIQVLEHFYKNKLLFMDGDRYISCSKPACYPCYLHIRHHPLQVVEPATHRKIYANWGPPLLPLGLKDPGYIDQRNLLNNMVKTIRSDALAQIRLCASGPAWHPDTTTGITRSIDEELDNQPSSLLSLEEQVAHLNIGEDDRATISSHDELDQSDSDLSGFGSATSVGGEGSQRVSEVEDDSDSDVSEVDDAIDSDAADSDADSDQEGGAVL